MSEKRDKFPRVHGNSKRLPPNAFTLETRETALNFIENFALANAVTLPGRVANYRDDDAKLLLIPSYETKECPTLTIATFVYRWIKSL